MMSYYLFCHCSFHLDKVHYIICSDFLISVNFCVFSVNITFMPEFSRSAALLNRNRFIWDHVSLVKQRKVLDSILLPLLIDFNIQFLFSQVSSSLTQKLIG